MHVEITVVNAPLDQGEMSPCSVTNSSDGLIFILVILVDLVILANLVVLQG